MKIFSLLTVCLGVLSSSIVSATTPGSLWTEYYGNPMYNPIGITSEDYYPSVVFNEECFHGNGDHVPYKMWHQGLNGIGYSISEDGVTWLLKTPTVFVGEAAHPCVLYDKDGFENGLYHYKMWFWNGQASTTCDAIQYAFSNDGISWTPAQPITQDASRPLVDGIPGGYFYHLRGPGSVTYNKDPSLTCGLPYTYPYVMLYDTASEGYTADGTFSQIALAYSLDGIHWTRYSDGPIFLPSGDTSDWDGTYAYRATFIKENETFHLYYSGSNSTPTTSTLAANGIGHATSTDGIYWLRDACPILSISADPYKKGNFKSPHIPLVPSDVSAFLYSREWRSTRTYAACVLFDTFSGSKQAKKRFFKMWFTGSSGNTLGQDEGLGYATSPGRVTKRGHHD